MIEYKTGINFDINLLRGIIELQNTLNNDSKITSVYGSMQKDYQLAARPKCRLPDVSKQVFERYVKECNIHNICFEYTLNSMLPFGSKKAIIEHEQDIKSTVRYLYDVGVKDVSVTHPLLMEIISDTDRHPNITISTIAHIDTITQIKYLRDTFNITKVCANLNKNRNFKWLEPAADWCNKNNIVLELMVNEFCACGTKSYTTHCVYRDSCYLCHATNETYDDICAYDTYPTKRCSEGRAQNPANWLKTRFIRPEDIHYYTDIGINHFKITGRTATSAYLSMVITAYLTQQYDGNLLQLWKAIESVSLTESESYAKYYIDNSTLTGFLAPWVAGKDCDNEVCGETCNYCNNYYEKYCKY